MKSNPFTYVEIAQSRVRNVLESSGDVIIKRDRLGVFRQLMSIFLYFWKLQEPAGYLVLGSTSP